MRLVIDISEEFYDGLFDKSYDPIRNIPLEHRVLVLKIKNGKPLDDVLNEIMAKIKALSPEPTAYDVVDGNPIKDAVWETLADALQIIDKYKAESEDKE